MPKPTKKLVRGRWHDRGVRIAETDLALWCPSSAGFDV